jgi:alginate O-acetyltransferase complex protein AlgI
LWHGASFAFVLWGMLHGIALIIERIFKEKINKRHSVFNWMVTFSFINFSWVFFRSNSVIAGFDFIKRIFKFDFGPIDITLADSFVLPGVRFLLDTFKIQSYISTNILYINMFLVFLFAFYAILCMKNTNERIEEFQPTNINAINIVIFLVWSLISLSGISTFLYFNF